VVSPVAYDAAIGVTAAATVALCAAARRRPGRAVDGACGLLAVIFLAEAVSRLVAPAVDGTWSVRADLPLNFCDLTAWLCVPALARRPATGAPTRLTDELVYFWGIAGGLQGIATPTVKAPFPQLGFMQYVVTHDGIVLAAFLVTVGLRRSPRRGAVLRVFALTCAVTALSGLVDGVTGADYLYLDHPPHRATLLSVLGPWPYYILPAAAVALASLLVLDLPFRRGRARLARR
jgi:hypothetical integral membrane protein (TIGR02206 family)